MRYVKLGHSSFEVSVVGLGCMGMSEFYGPRNDAESIELIHRALDVSLTRDELARIDEIAPKGVAVGERYP